MWDAPHPPHTKPMYWRADSPADGSNSWDLAGSGALWPDQWAGHWLLPYSDRLQDRRGLERVVPRGCSFLPPLLPGCHEVSRRHWRTFSMFWNAFVIISSSSYTHWLPSFRFFCLFYNFVCFYNFIPSWHLRLSLAHGGFDEWNVYSRIHKTAHHFCLRLWCLSPALCLFSNGIFSLYGWTGNTPLSVCLLNIDT